MNRRSSRGLFSAAVSSILVLGSGAVLASPSAASPKPEPAATASSAPKTTVRYQDTAGLLNYVQLAKALGYLPDITLKNVGSVTGGPAALQDLATGQIDYVSVAFTGAIENAISKGNKLKAVLSVLGSADNDYTALISKKGVNLSTPKSWIGKKIAVNTLGATEQAVVDTWLQRGGLTQAQIAQVTLVPVTPLDATDAVLHGQVDGTLASGPLLSEALKTGQVQIDFKDSSFLGAYDSNDAVMTSAWLAAHPADANEFIGGVAKAIRFTQTHPAKAALAKLVPWLKANGLTEDANALQYWTTNGVVTPGGYIKTSYFSQWIPWLKSQHLISGATPNVNSMFTNAYNPYAPK
jgi:ABC-type nitrate/sulfonate/bicarbonate transport system substrate-binding protein